MINLPQWRNGINRTPWPFPPPGGPVPPKKRTPTPEEHGEAPFVLEQPC